MLPAKYHRYIFMFGVYSMSGGIMLGSIPGSIPFLVLAANWLLEGDFAYKWTKIKSNALLWVLLSLFLLPFIGLLYTSNTAWATNVIRINLPLLAVPVVLFSSKPLNEKELNIALHFFLIGCFINTAWCLFYSFVLHHSNQLRDVSRFMSHIRLGLFLNLAIASCLHLFLKSRSVFQSLLFIGMGLYFIVTLYVLGLATGLANFVVLLFAGLCVLVYKQRTFVKIIGIVLLTTSTGLIATYIINIKNEQLETKNKAYNVLQRTNRAGRPLIHFDTLGQKENGNYVQINIQLEDLRKAWNKRMPKDTFSYMPQHNLNRYVLLLRYLTSKAYPKDAEGVALLSDRDIENISKDISNHAYPRWSYLHKRLYELVNEFDDYVDRRDVNGHSLTMRLYYWQAAMIVIKNNFWIGVGTGDTQPELDKVYGTNFRQLNKEWYKRPHNQFLSMAVAYGFIGFVIFLIALFYPIIVLRRWLPPLYLVFFALLFISFFTEDTLETQAGVAFYVIFNTLFCSAARFKKQQTPAG